MKFFRERESSSGVKKLGSSRARVFEPPRARKLFALASVTALCGVVSTAATTGCSSKSPRSSDPPLVPGDASVTPTGSKPDAGSGTKKANDDEAPAEKSCMTKEKI